MNIWTSLLSLVLFVDALLLCLLILLQLPKKEAGLAAAFGAEQTAAIFGAGSGNALTRITKWAAGIFLGLCLVISVLTAHYNSTKDRGLSAQLDKIVTTTPTTPAIPALAAPSPTNMSLPTLAPAPAPALTPAPAPAP